MDEQGITTIVHHDRHGRVISEREFSVPITDAEGDSTTLAMSQKGVTEIAEELRNGISQAGEVDDVRIDGHTIVDENKVANINSSQFGKVDDVRVNGDTVVANKVAEIIIPTNVSQLPNDADYATKNEAQAMADEAKITDVVVSVDDKVGTPRVDKTFTDGVLGLDFHNLKGEKGDSIVGPKGDQGDSAAYIPDQGVPLAPLFLSNILGDSTTKGMTQKAVMTAMSDLGVSEWENKTTTSLAGKPSIESDGEIVGHSSGNYKVRYIQVSDGDIVRVTMAHPNASGDITKYPKAIAFYLEEPQIGSTVSVPSDLLYWEDNKGEYQTILRMRDSGYLAAYGNGSSLEITMERGVMMNEACTKILSGIKTRMENVESDIHGSDVTPEYNTEDGHFIGVSGAVGTSSDFSITDPVELKKGDVMVFTCNGGTGGSNSILNYTNAEGTIYSSVWGNQQGLEERTFIAEKDCHVIVSFKNSDELQLVITRGGLKNDVANLQLLEGLGETINGEELLPIEGGTEDYDYTFTIGNYVTKNGNIPSSSTTGMRYTSPIQLEMGDRIVYKCVSGSSNCACLSEVIEEDVSYIPIQLGTGTDKVEERSYVASKDMRVAISNKYKNITTFEVKIFRNGVANNVDLLKASAIYRDENDGMPVSGNNPLAHIVSGPSRVRNFKSYGVIGASFETGYTNKSGTPDHFFDVGYEWPTLMANMNGVTAYNHALPGHSLNAWLRDKNSQAALYEGHAMPWSAHLEPAECYIINMSSNDMNPSKYSAPEGNINNIDITHDYSDEEYDENRPFTEVVTAIIQLCRKRSPKCFIFLATGRKYTASGTQKRRDDLCTAMKNVATLFENVFVLDMQTYGFDWPNKGVVYGYQTTSASSHPTRLGHIFLADQFNTYIDWVIGKNQKDFRDSVYVNTEYTRE